MSIDSRANSASGALIAEELVIRRGEKLLVRGLSLTVEPGQALVLVGPNGVGKSSLLRVMAGLLERAAGALQFQGKDPRRDGEAYATQIHFLGHRDGVKLALSVFENLRFWSKLMGGAPARCAEALDDFGLARMSDLPAAYLSAGQKRRLALTRLLAVPRPLWLLDEPAAGLDAEARNRLADHIAAHRLQGGLVVMASHGEMALPDARTYRVGNSA